MDEEIVTILLKEDENSATPGGRPPDPNRVLDFLNFREKIERGNFLFSKACKSLYRRRFKVIENAPLAAYEHFGHL